MHKDWSSMLAKGNWLRLADKDCLWLRVVLMDAKACLLLVDDGKTMFETGR